MRILPSGNDTGRLSPVKANRAVISQMGIGTYFAQEGVFEFGTKSLGTAAGPADDVGHRLQRPWPRRRQATPASRRSRTSRASALGIVVGSPALTQGVLALIAFAGLTEKDVTLVQFPSNNAMWKGIINNEADVALSSTISGQSKEADDLAARHPVAAHAGRRQGRLGAGPQEGALLHAA